MSTEPVNEAPAPAELILVVPTSSFDLLEGAADAKGRSRIFNAVVVVVAITVIAALISRGVLTTMNESSAREAATELKAESGETTRDLESRRRAGEVSKQALEAHLDERIAIIKAATTTELDYPRMLREITNLGSGITVNSIAFSSEGAPKDGPTPQVTTTAPAAAPAPQAKNAAVAVTVSGSATDTATASAATKALGDPARFAYLITGAPGSVDCSGGEGCTWTWNGTISEAGRTTRSVDLSARASASVTPTEGEG